MGEGWKSVRPDSNRFAMTPEQFSSFVRAEKHRRAPLVRAWGAMAD
jgi:hypothetical protein